RSSCSMRCRWAICAASSPASGESVPWSGDPPDRAAMTDDMASVVLDDTRERMQRAVVHARAEFANIRTGRAAPALVEKLPVDYYGSEVPLQQLAGFSVPEARMLVITPYDKGAMA